MCSCHSILECCVTFSGVKLSIRSFVLLQENIGLEAIWVLVFQSSTSMLQSWIENVNG